MSTTKRKSAPLVGDETVDTVQAWHGEYAEKQAAIKSITGDMEKQIAAIRQQYEPTLAPLVEASDDLFAKMQAWAEANKKEFEKKRSKETLFGKFGFRTGTPKLKTVKGFTWKSVKNLIKKAGLTQYIRTEEEVNKEAILANVEALEKTEFFGKDNMGCYVDQDERFFVEVKQEQPA